MNRPTREKSDAPLASTQQPAAPIPQAMLWLGLLLTITYLQPPVGRVAAPVGRVPAVAACIHTAPTTAAAHEVRVWIEDTDAYGIVYHANYARFVERAAHALLGRAACAAAFSERGESLGLRRVEGLKYTNAAVLGDALSVSLDPTSFDEARGALHVSASISRAADATPIWSCSLATLAFTHAQSGARVAWPLFEPRVGGERTAELMRAAPPPPPPPLRAEGEALPRSVALDATLEADELSAGGSLSLHAALRYFERQRSQAIGGPAQLRALHEAGTDVVVARVRYAALAEEGGSRDGEAATGFGATYPNRGVTVCSELTTQCSVRLKARATQVVFDQWLLLGEAGSGGGEPPLLARTEVTCLCIDPSLRRIVPAPPELQAIIAGL